MRAVGLGLAVISWVFIAISAEASQRAVFDRVWSTARSEIYPASLEARFSPEIYQTLATRSEQAHSLEDLAAILNPFLDSLGISHTKFYQIHDPDYSFMRTLFSTGDPDSHPIWQIGFQWREERLGYRVREALEGLPAARAEIRRGDLITTCDRDRFHPYHCFQTGRPVALGILRGGHRFRVSVQPVHESLARSFIRAMRNSVRVFEIGGRRIGYLHFWVGALDENTSSYDAILRDELFSTDALILDLRGGFGGASLERVDAFFPNRSSYARIQGIDRYGAPTKPEIWPEKSNPRHYAKPLMVLINEGVRSGKEMMAFQFKKTGRAKLIGTRTAGMFVAGQMLFSDEKHDYMLYLAAQGVLLDSVNLEGVGVAPDIEVPYPINRSLGFDPQLGRALQLLAN